MPIPLISAAQVPNTTPSGSPATLSDIVTTGMVNLNTNATSGARIGQGPQIAFPYSPGTYYPIVIEVGQTMVNVTGKNTSGVWLMGNGASVNTGTVAIGGTLTLDIYNSNGIIYLTENINTGGQSINFAQPVRLRPSVGPGNTISILTGGGSVTFKKTFDDDDAQPAGTNALTINTGVGAVTFSGAIGNAILPAAKPIGGLTIQTAGAVSFGTNVSTAKTSPTINGSVLIDHSGLLDFGAGNPVWILAGSFSEQDLSGLNSGTVHIQGTLDTSSNNGPVTFNRPVTLTGRSPPLLPAREPSPSRKRWTARTMYRGTALALRPSPVWWGVSRRSRR